MSQPEICRDARPKGEKESAPAGRADRCQEPEGGGKRGNQEEQWLGGRAGQTTSSMTICWTGTKANGLGAPAVKRRMEAGKRRGGREGGGREGRHCFKSIGMKASYVWIMNGCGGACASERQCSCRIPVDITPPWMAVAWTSPGGSSGHRWWLLGNWQPCGKSWQATACMYSVCTKHVHIKPRQAIQGHGPAQ